MWRKSTAQIIMAVFLIGGYSCKKTEKENSRKAVSDAPVYSNPLSVKFGDPYILNNGNGTYYMYGTGRVKNGFGVYSSTNLVDWDFKGRVYAGNKKGSWNSGSFWAPEVYKKEDRYYMFYSAQWRDNPANELENFKIGVAVADQPTGPFMDILNKPLFDPGYPVIDANVFMDSDGKYYLYYSRVCYKHPVESEIAEWARQKGWYDEIEESWVYGVRLNTDFSGIIGEPVLLLRPPKTMDDKQSEWESRSVTSHEVNRRWTEGSFTFKNNGIYYMMYSANHFAGENYAVGYATANHPLGPFTKADNNPVLEKNTATGGEVTGTGHNSVLFSQDSSEMYCIYHGRTAKSGKERVVFLDRMELREGKLIVHGPTTEPQPIPFTPEF